MKEKQSLTLAGGFAWMLAGFPRIMGRLFSYFIVKNKQLTATANPSPKSSGSPHLSLDNPNGLENKGLHVKTANETTLATLPQTSNPIVFTDQTEQSTPAATPTTPPLKPSSSPRLSPLYNKQGKGYLESKESNEQADPGEPGEWVQVDDLQIHPGLFHKGIIAIKPAVHTLSSDSLPNSTSFKLSARELVFGNSETTNAKKQIKLLDTLGTFSSQPSYSTENQKTLIYNKARREEVFLPIFVKNREEQQFGFYIYPWLSSNKDNFEFPGFSQFVVAGCIFGSSLKGQDDNGGTFPLIKHDIKFYDKQKIVTIDFNQEFGPYEKMLFSEFEKQTFLMKKFGKKNEKIQLYYHLPYYDYILFGVELFVRGRITLPALNSLFQVIFQRKSEHEEQIRKICEANDVLVKIESPFENIFGKLPANVTDYAKFIFDKLNLPYTETEIEPELDAKLQKEKEENLVQHCLSQLTTNTYRTDHRQAWENLAKIQKAKLDNLEQLFKLANATMIALACNGKKNYETCSLLPASEKQIQVSFAELNKQLDNKYPIVVNMTTLDALITCDNTSKGLLFYFGHGHNTLSKLIYKDGILDAARANVNRYSIPNTATPQTLLTPPKQKGNSLI